MNDSDDVGLRGERAYLRPVRPRVALAQMRGESKPVLLAAKHRNPSRPSQAAAIACAPISNHRWKLETKHQDVAQRM